MDPLQSYMQTSIHSYWHISIKVCIARSCVHAYIYTTIGDLYLKVRVILFSIVLRFIIVSIIGDVLFWLQRKGYSKGGEWKE